jgi:hypothetical protein
LKEVIFSQLHGSLITDEAEFCKEAAQKVSWDMPRYEYMLFIRLKHQAMTTLAHPSACLFLEHKYCMYIKDNDQKPFCIF